MYFEGKLKVKKTNEKGKEKTISEHYVIEDELFASCEYKLMEMYNGECEVTHIAKSSIREIVNGKEDDKPFFKAVIISIYTTDDGTEKELTYPVLVCAKDMTEANKLIKEYMLGIADMDPRLKEIKETKILDVL